MTAEAEWLVGRKDIARYLGVSVRTFAEWKAKYPDLPIAVICGRVRATKQRLDEWVYAHAENKCPQDGALCPRMKVCKPGVQDCTP